MARSQISVWRKTLDRIYNDQLRDLIINRHIFQQASEVWKPYAGRYEGAMLSQWMAQNYLAFAVRAIRRIAERPRQRPKRGNNSVSLVILLGDLASNHRILSRDWYVKMYPGERFLGGRLRQFGHRDFSKLAGSESAGVMPLRRITEDIAAIRRVVRPVERLANKVVAHTEHDRRRIGRPTWGKIDKAVDKLAEIYKRYYLLLTATSRDPFDVTEAIDVSDDLRKIWRV